MREEGVARPSPSIKQKGNWNYSQEMRNRYNVGISPDDDDDALLPIVFGVVLNVVADKEK